MVAKKKKPSKSEPRTVNKSDFVRNLPHDMPAADVVAKAEEAGFEISTAYVYSIRTAAKAKSSTTHVPSQGNGNADTRNTHTATLLNIAADIGYGEAIRLIQAERDRVRSLLAP